MVSFKITPIQSLQNLHLSGIDSESTVLSEKLLSEIHETFDVFLSERKTHNHAIHHILASLSLGATADQIQVVFEQHVGKLRAVPQALSEITRDNYKDYLNKAEAYTSFLTFFTSEIEQYGIGDTVRRWVWSGDMLTRTLGGLFHPIIHIGYGLEFKLPGIVAEGLAMACCTDNALQPLTSIRPDLNYLPLTTNAAIHIGSQNSDPSVALDNDLDMNPLIQTILKIQNDPELNLVKASPISERIKVISSNADSMSKIKRYLDTWELEATPESIHKNYRFLFECILILYGAAAFGSKDDNRFILDFVLMHCLTSAYFIYFYLNIIDPSEAVSLLREHWASTLFYYIITGRPYLNVDKLVGYRKVDWEDIMDDSIMCQEAHVVKSIRSLALGQMLFGSMESDTFRSLWVKVAHMTIVNDGKWSYDGLGFASTWDI